MSGISTEKLEEKMVDSLVKWETINKINEDFYNKCLVSYKNLKSKKRVIECYDLMKKTHKGLAIREIITLGISYVLDKHKEEAEKLSNFDLVLISDYSVTGDIEKAIKEFDHEMIEIINSQTNDYDTKLDYMSIISDLIDENKFDKNKIKEIEITKENHIESVEHCVDKLIDKGYNIPL